MNILSDDTICAISTPSGVGGIAVVRVSGPNAINIANMVWRGKRLDKVLSHTAHLGYVLDITADDNNVLDQALATVFISPNSFTGEDVVEFSVHGSSYVQKQLIVSLIHAGARLAEPGEFSKRAFLSGRMDLAQTEAVADMIASETKAAHRIAQSQMRGAFSEKMRQIRDSLLRLLSLLELELDFSEEDVEFASRDELQSLCRDAIGEISVLANSFHAGSAIKNGIPIAIVGATNAGKSSLLNALLGDDRAIVSSIHGTTRDVIEDVLRIGDYSFRIMDTAGLRDTKDEIEGMGIERSRQAAEKADIVLYVVDINDPAEIMMPNTNAHIIKIWNKADIAEPSMVESLAQSGIVISAKTGEGIDVLLSRVEDFARDSEAGASSVMVTNLRHYNALVDAKQYLSAAIDAIISGISGDLIALEIHSACDALSSILGEITSQEVLNSIFSRFCIGK